MRSLAVAILKKAAAEGRYRVSDHALQRMGERQVAMEDLVACLARAEILEIQLHAQDHKVCVRGITGNGEEFYTVVAICFPDPPTVITVCQFDDQVWEDLGSAKCRRRDSW